MWLYGRRRRQLILIRVWKRWGAGLKERAAPYGFLLVFFQGLKDGYFWGIHFLPAII